MKGRTLTRADLAEAVYQEVGLSRSESAELVDSILTEIGDSLVADGVVKISSFGTFSVRQKGRRIGRNPKTGEEVPIMPRRVLVFRALAGAEGSHQRPRRRRARRGGRLMVARRKAATNGTVRQRAGARPAKSAAAFRTISEVAGELDVAQHVLRFWESKFPQVRPLKRGGGRRYYRPEDVDLLRQIRSLLYEEGYTIKGAQKLLKGQRRPAHESDDGGPALEGRSACAARRAVARHGDRELQGAPELPLERSDLTPEVRERLRQLREELVALRKVLREAAD